MGITYEKAKDATFRLINRVLIEHHGSLHEAGVTIDAMMASSIDRETGEESQALRNRGYPVAAKIQVTSYQDRVRGIADAKLVLDAYTWSSLAESRRVALVDRELTRLVVVANEDGATKRDDLGRPKLKMRPVDFLIEGFGDVLERHGEASVEAREQLRFYETWGQLCLFPPAARENMGYVEFAKASE